MKRVVASSIIMKHLYLPKVLWLTSQPWYQVFCSGWVRPQSRVDSCISSSRVQLLNVADACRWDRGRGDEWTFKMIQNWLNISLASWTFSSSPPSKREALLWHILTWILKKIEKFSLSHLAACLDRSCFCAEVGMSHSANSFVLEIHRIVELD